MQISKVSESIIVKPVPKALFEVVASDLFTFANRNYLLIVDNFSGFYDFKRLEVTTSSAVIDQMKKWFAIHEMSKGITQQQRSLEFISVVQAFSKSWNFKHITSSPHHPRSNGLAERFVQTAKNLLKKCKEDNTDIELALLMARSTPAENLPSSAERLFKRKIRAPISFVEKQPVDLKTPCRSAQQATTRSRTT
jgi:hypothetical protein